MVFMCDTTIAAEWGHTARFMLHDPADRVTCLAALNDYLDAIPEPGAPTTGAAIFVEPSDPSIVSLFVWGTTPPGVYVYTPAQIRLTETIMRLYRPETIMSDTHPIRIVGAATARTEPAREPAETGMPNPTYREPEHVQVTPTVKVFQDGPTTRVAYVPAACVQSWHDAAPALLADGYRLGSITITDGCAEIRSAQLTTEQPVP